MFFSRHMPSKSQNFDLFMEEMIPLMNQLNGLFEKYGIFPVDNFIYFRVVDKKENRLSAFVNYETFPSPEESA